MKSEISIFFAVSVCFLVSCVYTSIPLDYYVDEDEYDKPYYPLVDDSIEDWETTRIVGGYDARIEDFPWQVSITHKGRHNCGGSILTKLYILTAGHCTNGLKASDFRVRVGSSFRDKGGEIFEVALYIQHPKYDKENFANDVSLLKLKRLLDFSDTVKPVTLLGPNTLVLYPGMFATVSGFGKLHEKAKVMSSRLQATDVPILSKAECRKLYHEYYLDEGMFCAGYIEGERDACAGDSGGPLTIDDIQIGIVSWGVGCASAGNPGVYTSVRLFIDFIVEMARP